MSPNTKNLPFFRPYIRSREIRAVRRVLRSGWLTTGPQTLAFEKEFADFLNRESPAAAGEVRCLAVNSATSGLHLALEAVGVGPGDLVAVPSLTFTSTAEVVCYLGADPVFIDSSDHDRNISIPALEAVVKSLAAEGRKLKAVIPVHLAGLPCDIKGVRKAVGEDTAIIEDAAHAFPCRTAAGMAGSLGDIGVFSFYVTKTITTGEGGMVATRNPRLAERMSLMRLHGIDRTVWNRYSAGAASRSWEYDVVAPGYKYNMTDIAAALGRSQLRRADSLLAMRLKSVEIYNRAFRDLKGVKLPPDGSAHAWHLYIIDTKSAEMRDRICAALSDRGIGSSVHFTPLHRMSYWKDRYSLDPSDFPAAELMADCNLSLPLWPGLKNRDLKRIIRTVREAADGR